MEWTSNFGYVIFYSLWYRRFASGDTTVGFSKGRTISIKDNRLKRPLAISSAIEVQMSYDVQLFGIFVGVR